jgi:hypothetical protein
VLEESAITAHTSITAVEDRRFAGIILVGEPVPVRLCTLVAALGFQSCLIGMDEVSMETQEVGGAVGRLCLVHMLSDEVIVPGLSTGDNSRRVLRWFRHQALDGTAVRLSLGTGHYSPWE